MLIVIWLGTSLIFDVILLCLMPDLRRALHEVIRDELRERRHDRDMARSRRVDERVRSERTNQNEQLHPVH